MCSHCLYFDGGGKVCPQCAHAQRALEIKAPWHCPKLQPRGRSTSKRCLDELAASGAQPNRLPLAPANAPSYIFRQTDQSRRPKSFLIEKNTWLATALEEHLAKCPVMVDWDGDAWARPDLGPVRVWLSEINCKREWQLRSNVRIPVIHFLDYPSRSGRSFLTLRLRVFLWEAAAVGADAKQQGGAAVGADAKQQDIFLAHCVWNGVEGKEASNSIGILELEGSDDGARRFWNDLFRAVAFPCAGKSPYSKRCRLARDS